MLFEDFPTEILVDIYLSCTTIIDTINLSTTCHRFRRIYKSSRNLPILEHAAESQYGPLRDLTQLLTHNASQAAHLSRDVPFNLLLLKQIVHHGRIAEEWCSLYPFKKWKHNFEHRRLLKPDECFRLRRAIYRLWLYTRAFHNRAHPRESRMNKLVVLDRAALLHNWSTVELAEIADVHAVMREVVHSNVCPSNGTIARKFKKRHPDGYAPQLLFNIHLNYPPPPQTPAVNPFFSQFHTTPDVLSNHLHAHNNTSWHSRKYQTTSYHEPGGEGWGDDIPHYYVVEDMLKLDPEQILWLKENAPLKGQVEMYVKSLGDWFENNGETWGQTLEWVLGQRGEEPDDILGAVADGELGIAIVDD
ncbi:hypothetical protein EJ05DRAFT_478127 [Pseudovirgaria hyperparasitica]|uniref:F-box domain-containing protein n=1 Tax=Pseudovirgaria hyperparasitica TaxID=470096 RepID=A0A6A6W0M0_9PEZI|nr:uncharacterized protein EJ05DRAFT_478127 [Pseudovirgaria hyperparasitica]KAF2756093.1 hypothetical protein EJ05DRAFT_478127 [Pseudovirgaria hyperparasitica]